MPSQKERARARARLQLEASVADDMNLLELQAQAADYVSEAKRRDASEPDELISTVVDAVARDYFGYVFRKRQRRAGNKPMTA